MFKSLTGLRLAQIRWCSRVIRSLSRIRSLFGVIRALREFPILRHLFIGLVGYNRPFPLLEDASASIVRYRKPGHEDSDHLKLLMTLARSARPSDYPALFHIRSILPHTHNIFDFGGNAGNLFYCYSKYLKLPSDVVWTVYDLPENIHTGVQVAKQRNESHLRFTNNLRGADEADLFIASGSLHNFERPLPSIIADFKRKPRYVLINRTPLTNGPALATVQDMNDLLVSCMLYNRDELIRGFEQMGYTMLDTWQVAELSLVIPGYPDRSAATYSGIFFKLATPVRNLLHLGRANASGRARPAKHRHTKKPQRRLGRTAAHRSSSSGRR